MYAEIPETKLAFAGRPKRVAAPNEVDCSGRVVLLMSWVQRPWAVSGSGGTMAGQRLISGAAAWDSLLSELLLGVLLVGFPCQ